MFVTSTICYFKEVKQGSLWKFVLLSIKKALNWNKLALNGFLSGHYNWQFLYAPLRCHRVPMIARNWCMCWLCPRIHLWSWSKSRSIVCHVPVMFLLVPWLFEIVCVYLIHLCLVSVSCVFNPSLCLSSHLCTPLFPFVLCQVVMYPCASLLPLRFWIVFWAWPFAKALVMLFVDWRPLPAFYRKLFVPLPQLY